MLLSACTVIASLALTSASSAVPPSSTTFYLRSGSAYQQGCFPPCACALMQQARMSGSFTLTPASSGDGTDVFTVSDVSLRVIQPSRVLTGTGEYRRSGSLQTQSMVLSLRTNNAGEAQTFTGTGPLLTPTHADAIWLTLSINGQFCFDTVLKLRATKHRPDWNADGSLTPPDLFAYLEDYFAGRGEYREDVPAGPAQIFAFLTDYFAGA